jgi:chromosome segregation ATPase
MLEVVRQETLVVEMVDKVSILGMLSITGFDSAGAQFQKLQGELQATTAKLAQLHEHSIATMRAKTALAEENERFKQQVAKLEAERKESSSISSSMIDAQQQVQASQTELEATRLELDHLKKQSSQEREELEQLRAVAKDLHGAADSAKAEMHEQILQLAKKEEAFHLKVSETQQVKQLMDMLQKKSQEVRMLRKQLAAQGPEVVADADD